MFEVNSKQCKTCIYKECNKELRKTVEDRVPDNSHQRCHSQKWERCCKWFFDNVKNSKIRMAENFKIVNFID